MVVLEGWRFLMSEVPLYALTVRVREASLSRGFAWGDPGGEAISLAWLLLTKVHFSLQGPSSPMQALWF